MYIAIYIYICIDICIYIYIAINIYIYICVCVYTHVNGYCEDRPRHRNRQKHIMMQGFKSAKLRLVLKTPFLPLLS